MNGGVSVTYRTGSNTVLHRRATTAGTGFFGGGLSDFDVFHCYVQHIHHLLLCSFVSAVQKQETISNIIVAKDAAFSLIFTVCGPTEYYY